MSVCMIPNPSIPKLISDMANDIDQLKSRMNWIEARAMSGYVPNEEGENPKSDALSFSEALEAVKKGCKIGCWHRDDIFVWVKKGDSEDELDYLMVRTIQGHVAPWLPNHRELLSEEWRVIDTE